MIIGNVYGVCCPVNISTEHIEFSRLRKTESVTLWTVHCRGKNKSLETGTPPALCVWHSVGGVFPCLSYEPVSYTHLWAGVLPAGQEAAEKALEKGCEVYRLYSDNTEGLCVDAKEIADHAAKGGLALSPELLIHIGARTRGVQRKDVWLKQQLYVLFFSLLFQLL